MPAPTSASIIWAIFGTTASVALIVVSGIWRFYRDEYYKGDYWDLGPGFYESFFTAAGPDDVVSSFQAIALT